MPLRRAEEAAASAVRNAQQQGKVRKESQGNKDKDRENMNVHTAKQKWSLEEEALLMQGLEVFGNDWGAIARFISIELKSLRENGNGEHEYPRSRSWREVADHVRKMRNKPSPEFRDALRKQVAMMMDEKLQKQRRKKWHKIDSREPCDSDTQPPDNRDTAEASAESENGVSLPSPTVLHVSRQALADPFEWWRKHMHSPRYTVAPMVDASELSFRMLCRNHGAELCYTPMLHAKNFVLDRSYRQNFFSTCEQDRPLLVQFCARDPQEISLAGLMAESFCDGIDLNLGCPQRIARKGGYGAFLMDELELVYDLVRSLRSCLSVPVTCKIRCFPNVEDTVQYARMLVKAGAQMICVHGRTRDQRGGYRRFPADWTQIKAVVDAIGNEVPVLANGNVRHLGDVSACMTATGALGVMSAESVLEEPAVFELAPEMSRVAIEFDKSNKDSVDPPRKFALAKEYMQLCDQYETPFGWQQAHVCRMLSNTIAYDDDMRDILWRARNAVDLSAALDTIQTWLVEDKTPRVRAAARQERVHQAEGKTVMVTEVDGTRHAAADEHDGEPSWVNFFDD